MCVCVCFCFVLFCFVVVGCFFVGGGCKSYFKEQALSKTVPYEERRAQHALPGRVVCVYHEVFVYFTYQVLFYYCHWICQSAHSYKDNLNSLARCYEAFLPLGVLLTRPTSSASHCVVRANSYLRSMKNLRPVLEIGAPKLRKVISRHYA